MYEIRFTGSKVKKQFLTLISNLSTHNKQRLQKTLTQNPYPSPTYGSTLTITSRVEKKGSLYCYELTGGDRVLYEIVETQEIKVVLIYYAGNHDGEIRFLKKFAK